MAPTNLATGSSDGPLPGQVRTASIYSSVAVVLVMLLAALVVVKWHQDLPLSSFSKAPSLPLMVAIDSESYAAMARDGVSQIQSPFSKRFLYPWLAGALSRRTGQPLPSVFLTLNLLALLTLAFSLAETLRLTVGKPFLALLFLLTPFPIESFEIAYMPDLFHAALLSLFFLALLREKTGSAALILLVAFLTRESTLVCCALTAGLAWFRGKKNLSLQVGGVLCVGWAASSFFGRLGRPNLHHLPDFLYLLGKVPYYFLLNILGLRVWSDVRPEEGTPFVTWHLPPSLKIGADSVIGLAYPSWRFPVATMIVWLTVFGVGPLVLWHFMRRTKGTRPLPFAIELALWYGVFSYLTGPLLGDWVDRLAGFGWPAFWIALPYLFYESRPGIKGWPAFLLAASYCLTCWWPRFFGYGSDRNMNPWPCFGALLFYFLAASVLRKLTPAKSLSLISASAPQT